MKASDEFDEAYGSLFSAAFQVGQRITGDNGEAERIAVETVARARASWRRVHRRAEGWVIRDATDRALRAARRNPPRSSRVPAEGPSRADVVAGLGRLSRRQRRVLALRYIVELSDAAISEVLGRSIYAVKLWRRRGVHRLRARLPAGN